MDTRGKKRCAITPRWCEVGMTVSVTTQDAAVKRNLCTITEVCDRGITVKAAMPRPGAEKEWIPGPDVATRVSARSVFLAGAGVTSTWCTCVTCVPEYGQECVEISHIQRASTKHTPRSRTPTNTLTHIHPAMRTQSKKQQKTTGGKPTTKQLEPRKSSNVFRD